MQAAHPPRSKGKVSFFVFYEMIDVGCVIAEYVLVGGLVTPGDGPCVDEVEFQVSFGSR